MSAGAARRQLVILNRQPLAEKITRARQVIRLAAESGGGEPIVSFSGGRDSVALAEIAREEFPAITLAYQNTGLADPRLVAWVEAYGSANLVHLPPARDPYETWKTDPKGCLPIGAKLSAQNYRRANRELRIGASRCCKFHKADPMHAWLRSVGAKAVLIGARGDDSSRHAFKLMWGEVLKTKKGWLNAFPLLTWTQQDTLQFLRERVPTYPLMYARNEELGCTACAINLTRWPNQLQKLRRNDPALHRRLIIEAGYGLEILMIRFGLTRNGAQQLVERYGWDRLIDEGQLDRIPQPQRGLR